MDKRSQSRPLYLWSVMPPPHWYLPESLPSIDESGRGSILSQQAAWAATAPHARSQLWKLGLLLLGSKSNLVSVIKSAEAPVRFSKGTGGLESSVQTTMLLTQAHGDNAIFRLKSEMWDNHRREERMGMKEEGTFEYGVPTAKAWRTHDPVIVDIGANLGEYSIAMAQMYPNVRSNRRGAQTHDPLVDEALRAHVALRSHVGVPACEQFWRWSQPQAPSSFLFGTFI